MAKGKERQALALSARLSTGTGLSKIWPNGTARGLAESILAPGLLEKEAARIVAEDEAKRANGGTSGHIVIADGRLSGFVKDAHTMVRFAGGAVAVTTHD